MRDIVKRVISVLLVCIIVISISGCSGLKNLFSKKSFNAGLFVKGCMDSRYLGQVDDEYLKNIDISKQAILDSYEDNLAFEAELFFIKFDIASDSIDSGYKEEVIELYRTILSKSKYEIGNTVKSGDNYLVSVTIYPIDVFKQLVEEDRNDFLDKWNNRYDSGEFDSKNDSEIAVEWANSILGLVRDRADKIGYLEPETISVQVVPETTGNDLRYTISDNDATRIDGLVIYY